MSGRGEDRVPDTAGVPAAHPGLPAPAQHHRAADPGDINSQ